MANTPPSPSPASASPSEPNKVDEPEVAAASAAEITYGKSSEDATDLSDLAAALEQATQTPSEDAGTALEAVAPTTEGEQERVLSKEEIVEEALNCPCIAAMRDGPCGDSFISAYRCFLESETEPKGMDCMEQFTSMQTCMAEHPEEYNLDDDEDDPFATGSAHDDRDGAKAEEKKEGRDVETVSKQESASVPVATASS